MMSENEQEKELVKDIPKAEVRPPKKTISIIWVVPLVALIVGGWLVFQTVSQMGPTITITFKSAEGLTTGKTRIKYKDVDLGKVTVIKLSDDLSHVVVTAELVDQAEDFLSENTRFWIERARVDASGVSGLSTIFSGAYIALDPGKPGEMKTEFQGLEKPPPVTTDLPGHYYTLQADERGSLEIGSPVYYRKIRVGQVVDYNLADDGKSVSIRIFINKPYDKYVYTNTRFWKAGGFDVRVDAEGVNVDTQSVVSLLIGGIAFGTPHESNTGLVSKPESDFSLFKNYKKAQEKEYKFKSRWVLYFDESVRGLAPGAPVMLKGIQIGKVMDLQLEFDIIKKEFSIPVIIEIEGERIISMGEPDHQVKMKNIADYLAEKGFRAQLDMSSILTGKLLVVFDIFPDAPPAEVNWDGPLPVYPTVPAPMGELGANVTRILDKINKLPLEQLTKDLQDTVKGASSLVNSKETASAIHNLNATLRESRLLLSALRKNVTPQIGSTLKQAQDSLAGAQKVLDSDSTLQVKMKTALDEISSAARSLRNLANYLERHPEALIKGKGSN